MGRALLSLLVLICAGCATTGPGSGNNVELLGYVESLDAAHVTLRADVTAACLADDSAEAQDMYLVINGHGIVDDAYMTSRTPQARCLRLGYLGTRLPVPPYSPLLLRLTISGGPDAAVAIHVPGAIL